MAKSKWSVCCMVSSYLTAKCSFQLVELTFTKVGVAGGLPFLLVRYPVPLEVVMVWSSWFYVNKESQPTVVSQVKKLAFFSVWCLLTIFQGNAFKEKVSETFLDTNWNQCNCNAFHTFWKEAVKIINSFREKSKPYVVMKAKALEKSSPVMLLSVLLCLSNACF